MTDAGLFCRQLLQPLVLFLRQTEEGTVLWTGDALDVYWVVEVAQELVSLTNTIMLGIVTILNISYTPGIFTE